MIRVLVVDDDKHICEMLKLYLCYEGYEVLVAHNGSEALDMVETHTPDIILLDIMLPVINGWEVCKMIRRKSTVPIIMLTARDSIEDKLEGLDIGADDYVVKPFDPKEVVARVKVQLRRKARNVEMVTKDDIVSADGLSVNMTKYEVCLDGIPIQLKPKEIQLLYFLMKNKNIVFDRDRLLEAVWGYDYVGETRTVDVHIKRLRQKLINYGARWDIKTIWGVGYKFEVK